MSDPANFSLIGYYLPMWKLLQGVFFVKTFLLKLYKIKSKPLESVRYSNTSDVKSTLTPPY